MFIRSNEFRGEPNTDEIIFSPGPGKLLSMGKEFEKAGVVSYAIDIYTKILHKYPDTFEATAARMAIFLIAGRYWEAGNKESVIPLIDKLNELSSSRS